MIWWMSYNIDLPIFRNSLAKFKNEPNRHLSFKKYLKIHILKFRAPLYEEIPHEKIPNLKLNSVRNVN